MRWASVNSSSSARAWRRRSTPPRALGRPGGDDRRRLPRRRPASAHDFVAQHMFPEIDMAIEGGLDENHKSELQQVAQRSYSSTPSYQLVDEKGPDHASASRLPLKSPASGTLPRGTKQERSRTTRRPQRAQRNERDDPPYDSLG